MARALCKMGGVKCQPFLKHSNHWKRALKMIFKGSGCFQFPETIFTSEVYYKLSLFYRSRNFRVQLQQTSVAKVSICCN